MLWEAFKILLIGVTAYGVTSYFLGGIPSILSAISAVMIIELLELMKHHIENINNKNYFWENEKK